MKIAKELGVTLSEDRLGNLRGKNLVQLQKELGNWNVRKREMLKAKARAPIKMHVTPTSLYDESGLNAEAVSTPVTRKKEISKDKPPEVEPIRKLLTKAPIQVRHSYTVRLKLQMQDTHVNVSQKLKEIFSLWKTADSSTILLAYDNENNSNLMIDDVNKIPYDENEVKKYVMGMYQYHGKLHFSLRMSGYQTLGTSKLKFSNG